MLNAASRLKGEKDWMKYETARKLRKHIDKIRSNYIDDFKSKEMKIRQRATALYFIDKVHFRSADCTYALLACREFARSVRCILTLGSIL